ncbi:MAG: NAD-dependent succinate-semialdehyde dehydrogenase, partial [Spongiibacteraceae bacterium]
MSTVKTANISYPKLSLCIDGQFLHGSGRHTEAVINPANEHILGELPHATAADLDAALAVAQRGFDLWRKVPALERSQKLRHVADLIRQRKEAIAPLITLELGKPVSEALIETNTAAEIFEWIAEETRRSYGRTIPARVPGMRLIAERVPVGPVAGFSGWNAPLITPARKISGALGAGCSVVMKPAETTPAVALALMQCILDADIPASVVSLIFGDPAFISQQLLQSPIIRLVTFTGSVNVGKQLTALAAQTMKRSVMELGGHAPAIICDDVDVEAIALNAITAKFRNSGQVCTSPTRFFVQRSVYEKFVERFATAARAIVVGDGFDPSTKMGPLANRRRLDAIAELIDDAVGHGAKIVAGGKRLSEPGFFFEPTVLRDVPADCRAMKEEPFGPLALITPFDDCEEVIQRA